MHSPIASGGATLEGMILPPDTRVPVSVTNQYPYSATVNLVVTFPNGTSYTGSGVMIGPNDVLTASHLLYHQNEGGYASSIVVTPGRNGASSAPYGTAFMKSIQVDQGWVDFGSFARDFGFITLDRDIGYSTGWHSIASLNTPVGALVYSTGYPGDKGSYSMYVAAGTIDGADQTTYYFYDDLDVVQGQSGSPVFYTTGTDTAVIGIISYDFTGFPAYNGVARIDPTFREIINGFAISNDQTNGPDFILGGRIGELWDGLAGADTIMGFDGNDTVFGGFGDDDLNGNTGNDLVSGDQGADFVRGGQGNDVVFGDDGDDWHVNGNIGDDFVFGGGGNDTVHGGPNSDWLEGGDGRDVLSGDLGNDTLVGGAGADLFYFGFGSGTDVILDFDLSQDRLFLETTYTKFAAQNGTYIDLGGGHGFTVVGVTPGQLSDFYFL